MLSEVSQKKTNIKTMCYQFYMGLKRKKTNVKNKADTDWNMKNKLVVTSDYSIGKCPASG